MEHIITVTFGVMSTIVSLTNRTQACKKITTTVMEPQYPKGFSHILLMSARRNLNRFHYSDVKCRKNTFRHSILIATYYCR